MGMQMNRNTDILFERLDQLVGGKRLEQPGHILDRQDVGAHLLQLFCHVDIVFKRVLVPFRIE